jgi:heme oxygenase
LRPPNRDPTLLDRLRVETRPAHERIEAALDIGPRISSPGSYRALLSRFYGFHRAWEPQAERIIADPAFLVPRRKTPLLVRDLKALGLSSVEIDKLPACQLMPIAGPAAALGAMYVVEGSTLGGNVISRQVRRSLGLCPESGCAYFGSYGGAIGAQWKMFTARLLAVSSPETDDDVVASASRTFALMQEWLCGAPA